VRGSPPVDEWAHSRSPELDAVRALLFPHLTEREGWARIDAADDRQRDPARWERIEALARREPEALDGSL